MSDDFAIEARGLGKTYRVPVREPGLGNALRSLFRPRTRAVNAVDGVDLRVSAGEVVGFLGPNGAGKTTTLKMLSGLLHPSEGTARVLGFEPARREHAYLSSMTLVMGQRNQLVWDIPVADSFERNRAIYRIERRTYDTTLGELDALLGLGELLQKPARNLSLGERMKCEVAAALLHRPRVLFLDEPTIGLDVTMQRRIREFLAEYNRRTGATILLTSHYMADVEALCRRVIVIHRGRILFDGPLSELRGRFATHKTLSVHLGEPDVDLAAYGEVMAREGDRVTLRVDKERTAEITAALLERVNVRDLTIEDTSIEEVIERVFAEGTPE